MENIKEVPGSHLATLVRCKTDQVLVIDSRTFCEFNTSHVMSSVNVWSSKIRKKRLQQNSMSVQDYLSSACEVRRSTDLTNQWSEIVIYDQSAPGLSAVPTDSFLYVLLDKLSSVYKNVQLLTGGFLEFQSQFPDCCEDATQKCSPLTSLSQPCLPVANVGPTKIFHFLYLGSQHDANNKQMLNDHHILYELNVSNSCPKPDFVQDSHFLRIPVNDNFSERLLPHFWEAFNFIDKVRESGGSVLVHCLAGISRSATVAIAYVMKHLRLSYDEGYRYVKHRRPTISPNINFVGQLLELDKLLRMSGRLNSPNSAPATFRQNSPYLSSCFPNASSNLEYDVNRRLSGLSTVRSFTDSLEIPLQKVVNTQEDSVDSCSLTNVIDETNKTSIVTDADSSRTFVSGLYRKENNMCTNFGKNLVRDVRITGNVPRSLSLNLKTTLEAVPGSPESTPQSPAASSEALSPSYLPFRSSTCNTPSSPNSPFGLSYNFKQQFSSSNSGSTSSIRSLMSPSLSNQGSFSPTLVEIRKSPTLIANIFEKEYAAVSREENMKNDKYNNNNQTVYSSTATLSVDASPEPQDDDSNTSPRSVCIIEVNTPVTYVDNSSDEPMIIKETEVYATPCDDHFKMDENIDTKSINNENNLKNKFKEERNQIRGSSSLGNILDRPKVLELCAPIYNVNQKNLPIVLGDSYKSSFNKDVRDFVASDTNANCTASESEVASVADSSDFADTASQFSVMQSDSGVSFQTDYSADPNLPPQHIPRCYSSSETHLNTRRLLEASNEYTTKKSCSNDEVAKTFGTLQKSSSSCTQSPVSRECAIGNNNIGASHFLPSNWNHGELVRCDSWSTSGFGSELSDWESLQEDVVSTHCDDAVGPYDAVFSDVFPGEKTDSFMEAFPEFFNEEVDTKTKSLTKEYCDKKPRHNSFKDHQRWRHKNMPSPLSRPASLPGVMAKYLATEKNDSQGVELRPPSSKVSSSNSFNLKRASVSSRDSGLGGSIRGSYSSGKFNSGDLDAVGVKRNDSGYYSVFDKPASRVGKSKVDEQKLVNKHIPPHVRIKKVPMKPQNLAISIVPSRIPTNSNIPPLHPNYSSKPEAKSVSSRTTLSKSPSPTKCTSQTKQNLDNRRSHSPEKKDSSNKSRGTPESPQPRTFGSSTFYLPESEFKKQSNKFNFSKASSCKEFSELSTKSISATRKSSNSYEFSNTSNANKSSYSFKLSGNTSSRPISCTKLIPLHSKSMSPTPCDKLSIKNTNKHKSPSPTFSFSRASPSLDSESCSSDTTCINQSLNCSRETSVESDSSFAVKTVREEQVPGLSKQESAAKDEDKGKTSDEKRRSLCDFGSGEEEVIVKEKRKSCDFDLSTSGTELNKKSVSIKTGVRLAQELLQSMENLVSSELSEIRRCTAELSSRYRLKTTATTTTSNNKPTSKFYIYSVATPSITTTTTTSTAASSADTTARARSEPPFTCEEGLYRAQSCPGLPQPLVEASEGQETVAELKTYVPKLRTEKITSTREKLLNRYSCGTLDSHIPLPQPPVCRGGVFESCPDLGTLRSSRLFTSGDSSGSSVSSSRSSFTRLLSVS